MRERELLLFTLHDRVLWVVGTRDELEQECVRLVLKQTFHVMLWNQLVIKPSQFLSESSKW